MDDIFKVLIQIFSSENMTTDYFTSNRLFSKVNEEVGWPHVLMLTTLIKSLLEKIF